MQRRGLLSGQSYTEFITTVRNYNFINMFSFILEAREIM